MNTASLKFESEPAASYFAAMLRLIGAVQELSLARDLDAIMIIVRRAARELTCADGATFVLRDRDACHYAEEDAIAPLWKGRRFPMSDCVSGWVMLQREPAVIEDIYADPRIPADAYRPTFVRSLVMVPIRTLDPVGAIGIYWARLHRPSGEDVKLLQALADSTAVAMESVRLSAALWQHQAELAQIHRLHTVGEMASVLAHELNQPLAAITGYSEASLQRLRHARIDTATLTRDLEEIGRQAQRAGGTIRDLRRFLSRTEAEGQTDLNDMVRAAEALLAPEARACGVRLKLTLSEAPLPVAVAPVQLEHVLVNLVRNATQAIQGGGAAHGTIAISTAAGDGQGRVTVRDSGPGFDAGQGERLFERFYTTKPEGLGMGLAICRSIVEGHEGKIWAERPPEGGAAFHFTLPLRS